MNIDETVCVSKKCRFADKCGRHKNYLEIIKLAWTQDFRKYGDGRSKCPYWKGREVGCDKVEVIK